MGPEEPGDEYANEAVDHDEGFIGRGRTEGKGDDASVWREETESRLRNTRQWLLSGKSENDMAIAAIVFAPLERRVLGQLAMSGERWERREQKKATTGSTRDFQALLAFDGKMDSDAMKEASALLFSSDPWQALRCPNEADLARAFKVTARLGAGVYMNLWKRHKTWPYKLFDILRSPATATELGSTPDCMLDPFTEGFNGYYGNRVAGPAATAELSSLLLCAHTDVASTERWHSTNLRRSEFRVHTHKADVASLSAWWMAAQSKRHDSFGVEPGTKSGGTRKPAAKGPVSEGNSGKRRPGAGGAWRAFVHVECQGQVLSPAMATELSVRYHALTPTQREFYETLGMLASAEARSGQRPFGPRVRTPAPPPLADAQHAPQADAPPAAGEPPYATPIGPSLPGCRKRSTESLSYIVKDALRKMAHAKDEANAELEEAVQDAKVARQWSAREAQSPSHAWHVVSGGPVPTGGDVGLSPVPHLSPVMESRHQPSFVAERAAAAAKASSDAHRSKLWQSHHNVILEKNCPPLGFVQPFMKQCWGSGTCLCTGEGITVGLFVSRVRGARLLVERAMPAKAFRNALANGDVIIRLTGRAIDGSPAAGDDGTGVAAPSATFWLHVSFHLLKPWRVAFTELERCEPMDREDAIGLKAIQGSDGQAIWSTLHEFASKRLDLVNELSLSWVKLYYDETRSAGTFLPCFVRVKAWGPLDVLVWKGKANEKPAGQGRGRGRGRGRGGGGRGGVKGGGRRGGGKGGKGDGKAAAGGEPAIPIEDAGNVDGEASASNDEALVEEQDEQEALDELEAAAVIEEEEDEGLAEFAAEAIAAGEPHEVADLIAMAYPPPAAEAELGVSDEAVVAPAVYDGVLDALQAPEGEEPEGMPGLIDTPIPDAAPVAEAEALVPAGGIAPEVGDVVPEFVHPSACSVRAS